VYDLQQLKRATNQHTDGPGGMEKHKHKSNTSQQKAPELEKTRRRSREKKTEQRKNYIVQTLSQSIEYFSLPI
jgi:hypothetical protein